MKTRILPEEAAVSKAAITVEQVEHFPDLSFKWLLDASGNLQGLIQIARPDIGELSNFQKILCNFVGVHQEFSTGR